MEQRAIPLNDLYAAMKDHPEYFATDGIHFNDQGTAAQAKAVAESVEQALKRRPPPL